MKRILRSLLINTLLLLCICFNHYSQVRLPQLISNGVVLQRNANVRIWGWASAGENITVEFQDISKQSQANVSGEWEVFFPDLQPGGPYEMVIKGSNVISISNILVGDVWVCSGQSNMELNMKRASPLYEKEIANSLNDNIHYFAAPQTYNFKGPLSDYNGGVWQSANPTSVLGFGAIAYFFAKEINAVYKVPVGIINTAIGGTPAEAWISEDAIKSFPVHYNELQKFKDDALIKTIEQQDREKVNTWFSVLGQKDMGNKGVKWSDPTLDAADWNSMIIPGYWAKSELGFLNGIVWFRKDINIPAKMAGKQAKLLLGRIVDADSVFMNGTFIGTTTYQYPPRRYEIPAGILVEGKNTLVVKITNNGGLGGFVPDKPYEITFDSDTVDLQGEWRCKVGAKTDPMPPTTTIKYKPSGLYNAMISPLLKLQIKGILWYQGESNAERPIEHGKLFPALINDWRMNWKRPDLPFLYVQLPNFMEENAEPVESNWALFRESQLKTLSVSNTGMAVAIDVGEWNDIHPLNKLDVAKRLTLAARKVAYHEKDLIFSGPIYQSMKIKGKKIELQFNQTGSGLIAKGGEDLKQFAIAGADKKFVWATAQIKGNKVIVWNNRVLNPVAVRYAWSNNPKGANLYNQEGLPTSPFRTDNW